MKPQYEEKKIDELRPNKYNPNVMGKKHFNLLVKEIQRNGFLQPVLVNQDGIIIDGEHRWRAAKEAKLLTIPVVSITVDEPTMKTLTINMNQIKGSADPRLYAELVVSLGDELGRQKISEYLAITNAEYDSLKILLNLQTNTVEREFLTKSITYTVHVVLDEKEADEWTAKKAAIGIEKDKEALLALIRYEEEAK